MQSVALPRFRAEHVTARRVSRLPLWYVIFNFGYRSSSHIPDVSLGTAKSQVRHFDTFLCHQVGQQIKLTLKKLIIQNRLYQLKNCFRVSK